jgi:hypothetical protein
MKPDIKYFIFLTIYLSYLKETSPIRYLTVVSILNCYEGSLEELWNVCLERYVQPLAHISNRANELRNWSTNYY